MIASSLGAFIPFRKHLPPRVMDRIDWIEAEIGMVARMPNLYPPLEELDISQFDVSSYLAVSTPT
jgi:hypothetical protein